MTAQKGNLELKKDLADTFSNESDDDKNRRQYITFTVSGQEYGVDIMEVREIKGWSLTTTLPNTPPYMRGVVNLRGTVVPILDLRARFGLGMTEASSNHVVMIVNVDSKVMGILVDAVSDILTITVDQIRTLPDTEGNQDKMVLNGLVNVDNRMVALIVLEKLFDHNIQIASANIQGAMQFVADEEKKGQETK